MTELVLFHHVLGLTAGVRAFADRLREDGHVVQVPDLFDGQTFETLEQGFDFATTLGFENIVDRAVASQSGASGAVVFGGFSLGVMAAQHLLQTTPDALGGIFLHSFIDPSALGGSWPDALPVQVHGMDNDPFFVGDGDLQVARAVQAHDPNLEILLYPGSGHLFTDSTNPDYDTTATEQVLTHANSFLTRLG